MMLFPKALDLATTFPKIVKNSILHWIFIKNFQNFLKNVPTVCVSRPNAWKINAWLVKSFEKSAKIIHFCTFLKKIFANFRTFSAPRGCAPGPLRGRPPKMFPLRNEILATPWNDFDLGDVFMRECFKNILFSFSQFYGCAHNAK